MPKSRLFRFHTSIALNDAKIYKFCDRTTQLALTHGTARLTMAGIKRKQAPVNKTNGNIKKPRIAPGHQERKATKKFISEEEIEAETDSDPIIESDTTEHSGEDDGASWPSDDEQRLETFSAEEHEDGAVVGKLASASGKQVKQAIALDKSTNGNNSESMLSILGQPLTVMQPMRPGKHMQSKRQ